MASSQNDRNPTAREGKNPQPGGKGKKATTAAIAAQNNEGAKPAKAETHIPGQEKIVHTPGQGKGQRKGMLKIIGSNNGKMLFAAHYHSRIQRENTALMGKEAMQNSLAIDLYPNVESCHEKEISRLPLPDFAWPIDQQSCFGRG